MQLCHQCVVTGVRCIYSSSVSVVPNYYQVPVLLCGSNVQALSACFDI